MAPRHVSKTIFNPYFSSEHYKETQEYKNEKKVEDFFKKIKDFILRKKK
jgi:hypothetical protein